jgi:hypothetical protein
MLPPRFGLPLLASALARKPSTASDSMDPELTRLTGKFRFRHRAVDQMATPLTPQSERRLLHRSGYEHTDAMCVLIKLRHYWLFRPIVQSDLEGHRRVWFLMCTSQTNSRVSMLDVILKTPWSAEKDQCAGRTLWIQRYGIFASLQNLRHDPFGGFWLLCRALVLLHNVLQLSSR